MQTASASALVSAMLAWGCVVNGGPRPGADGMVEPEAPAIEEEPELIVDPLFSDAQRQTILGAAAKWQVVGAELGNLVVAATTDAWVTDVGISYGRYSPRAHTVTIVVDAPSYVDLWKMALHEIGHAAGADHHSDDGVMTDTFWSEVRDCITPNDLELLGLDGPGTCEPTPQPAVQ